MAADLGASYAGVIFAGGPRLVSPERAREVFAPLSGSDVRRVGVFGVQPIEEIARLARAARVDVVQLHGGATAESIAAEIHRIPVRLTEIFARSGATDRPTSELADEMARQLLAEAR